MKVEPDQIQCDFFDVDGTTQEQKEIFRKSPKKCFEWTPVEGANRSECHCGGCQN